MKKNLGFLLLLLLSSVLAFSQNEMKSIQGPTLGVHFLLHDFKTASAIRSSSLTSVLRNKQFGKIRDMSAGLAINYIKGISPKFDFTSMIAGSFLDYPRKNGGILGDNKLLLELDASIRGKMLPNNYWVSPYLQLGIGVSKYESYWGAIVPAGLGLQFNLSEEAVILLNSQYRFSLTQNTSSPHFFYSIGLAGMIGKKKTVRKTYPTPAPVVATPIARDRDGDGIVDTADACPDIAGMAKFKGCPDTDEDDIPDFEDKCPRQKGIIRYQGCPIPDQDQDGVNDENDKCPTLPGNLTDSGCPVIKKEILSKVEVAAKNVLFATGSHQLLKSSYTALDEVVKLMNEDLNIKLNIEGHTDNVGTPEKNQVLSEERAKAVYDYLASNGIEKSRLKFDGFGQQRPVSDNVTKSGRQNNRRVEFKINY